MNFAIEYSIYDAGETFYDEQYFRCADLIKPTRIPFGVTSALTSHIDYAPSFYLAKRIHRCTGTQYEHGQFRV
jgi:hypothetical protein